MREVISTTKKEQNDTTEEKKRRSSARPSGTQQRSTSVESGLQVNGSKLTSTPAHLRRSTDHIAENKERVKTPVIRRPPSVTKLENEHKRREKLVEEHKRGHVPKYLQTRKEQWKKEEDRKSTRLTPVTQ